MSVGSSNSPSRLPLEPIWYLNINSLLKKRRRFSIVSTKTMSSLWVDVIECDHNRLPYEWWLEFNIDSLITFVLVWIDWLDVSAKNSSKSSFLCK